MDIIININTTNNISSMTCSFPSELIVNNLKINCMLLTKLEQPKEKYNYYFPRTEISKSSENIFEIIILDDIEIIREEDNEKSKNSSFQNSVSFFCILIILLLI